MGFTLRPKNVPKVSGETHTHVTTTVPHRGWGDLEPSPAPGRTPPSTAARRAGRRRRRPGPCTAVPGGRSDPEHLGDTFLSPPVFCGGGRHTTRFHAYPARPGSAAGTAAVREVFGAGGLPGGEVDAEMGAPVEYLPGGGGKDGAVGGFPTPAEKGVLTELGARAGDTQLHPPYRPPLSYRPGDSQQLEQPQLLPVGLQHRTSQVAGSRQPRWDRGARRQQHGSQHQRHAAEGKAGGRWNLLSARGPPVRPGLLPG